MRNVARPRPAARPWAALALFALAYAFALLVILAPPAPGALAPHAPVARLQP